jgi:protein O-GlcNAc transferase
MGVPVITLAGKRYVERLSATKLVSVGVEELITTSVDEYVSKAIELTQDLAALEHYHKSLRERMLRSPLCDALSLAQALEAAYREMWIRYSRWRQNGRNTPCVEP